MTKNERHKIYEIGLGDDYHKQIEDSQGTLVRYARSMYVHAIIT